MSDLTSLRNIGKEMSRKLAAVGIDSSEKLMELGTKEAFFKLKTVFPNVCLVHLYVLEGAVQDMDYNRLPVSKKIKLKAFSDFLKGEAM